MNDNTNPLVPHRELLRKAVNWIAEQENSTPQVIEEASIRYNWSPKDEDFLMRHFLRQLRE